MKSIYEQILEAVGPDGTLPNGFELQTAGGPQGITMDEGPMAGQTVRYAPGALDGIYLYHGGGETDEEQLEQMKQFILRLCKERDPEGALAVLMDCFAEKDGMLACASPLQKWIVEHQDELNKQLLFMISGVLLIQDTKIGVVKFALTVLELLGGTEGEWRKHVRLMALYDEFTLFCARVMERWENRDEELFDIARKVRGWGRVHAVRKLNPVSQEMKDWLLDEGWDNDVLPAYTARICAERGRLMDRLSQPMTRSQLDAAGGLVRALLDEGPCRNISRMENREALLLAYLDQVERAEPTEEERKTVRAILESAAEKTLDLPLVRVRARVLLNGRLSNA